MSIHTDLAAADAASRQRDLFTPFRLGPYGLSNRIVMAPLTRNRAGPGGVIQDLNVEYYAQRASAGLIITEGSQVSSQGVGCGITATFRDHRSRFPHMSEINVRTHDRSAFRGHADCARATDTARSAGDERNFAVEFPHRSLLPSYVSTLTEGPRAGRVFLLAT